jgi:hypothetical protein
MNINLVTAAKIAGTLLSVGGALLTGWAGQKNTDATIAKQVEEALAKQVNQQ